MQLDSQTKRAEQEAVNTVVGAVYGILAHGMCRWEGDEQKEWELIQAVAERHPSCEVRYAPMGPVCGARY